MDTTSTPLVVTRRKLMMIGLIAGVIGATFAYIMISHKVVDILQTLPQQGIVEKLIECVYFFWLALVMPILLLSLPITRAFPGNENLLIFLPFLMGVEWAVISVGVVWLTRKINRRYRWNCYILTVPLISLFGMIIYRFFSP